MRTCFVVQRYSKSITYIKLKDDDEVVDVCFDAYNEVFLATKKGYGFFICDDKKLDTEGLSEDQKKIMEHMILVL